MPELGPGITPRARLTRLSFLLSGHVSALKSLLKSHNRKKKDDPIRLDFETVEVEIQGHTVVKGNEVMDEDLRKPFKEARRTPFTSRIIKFGASGWFERLPHDSINEWAELREAFFARFSVIRACFKEPYEITKIIRKDNESLTAFKERWTVEASFIMGVPEVMKISLFMDSVKSPELGKRFSNKVPITVNEMMERLDDFVRFEEAYASTELPKEETGESHRKMSLPFNGRDTRNADRYCDYHQEKDHYTNDCTQIRKKLEMALESGKLNHLVKDRKVRETTELWMNIPISFLAISSEDVYEEPLIVEAEVEGYLVRRVYMDEGSSVEVMFEHCFENLNPKIKDRLRETQTDLVGFAGEVSKPLGKIDLEVCFENL
nr:reverse transcriptase domain-containing protein [Tanacetum cinerariifolium]